MGDFHENGFDITRAMLGNSEGLKENLSGFIRETVRSRFKKAGIVIGVSGGIDSAVVAALAVDALGPEKVFGLILPEKESSPSSLELGEDLCTALAIPHKTVPITPMLEAFGVYSGKGALIRQVFPEYDPARHATSLTRPPVLAPGGSLNLPSLVLLRNGEPVSTKRLSSPQFMQMLSLQNVKQRTRMIVEYMHAESMNYAVCGTTNKTEMLLGFFVKYGDGGVDLEPIANCYKTQVRRLAELLGIDQRIVARAPSPDTWSHFTSDEDIALRIPYDILDQLLFAQEHRLPPEIVQENIGMDRTQFERAEKHVLSLKSAALGLQGLPPVYLFDGETMRAPSVNRRV